MESLREYETINVSNNSKGLLFIIEKECLNTLDVIPRYSIATTSITHDPRLTKDITDITDQDIVALLAQDQFDFEIVKLNTLFYCINNNTDSLGWQYTHRPIQKDPEEKDEETTSIIEEEWSKECSEKNFRRRLWILQTSLPLEREEIQSPHYELNENFENVLLFSKETIDVKVIEHENSLSDYESDCSLHIYYRFIKIYSGQNQEHEFPISNHTRVSIFHDSLRPYSIQILDREFNLIIAMTSVIDNRNIYSILSHVVDIHKSKENMVSSTYMKYHNPTCGVTCPFPLLYSDILVITDTFPQKYSLRLFSHRIELYFKGRKLQSHSLREGRIHDTGKLEFVLEFEHCSNQIITILFRYFHCFPSLTMFGSLLIIYYICLGV